jgi:hypothetical protein
MLILEVVIFFSIEGIKLGSCKGPTARRQRHYVPEDTSGDRAMGQEGSARAVWEGKRPISNLATRA